MIPAAPDLPRAACAGHDPDWWFANGHGLAVAKRICSRCPERAPCHAWAVEHGEQHGVWGGAHRDQPSRRRGSRRAAA